MGLDKISSSLDLLLGYNVNLYIGEEIVNGKLIGVERDHIIVEDNNNYVFYYSFEQIQAITKNTKLFQSEETTANFIRTQSLTEVLNSFKNTWITILCVNKQKFNGIMSQVDEDFATLINGEEKILIKLSQISNILKGYVNQEGTNSASTNASSQSNSKNENSSNHKSDSSSQKNDDAKNKSDSSSDQSDNKSKNKSDSSSSSSSSSSKRSDKKSKSKSNSSSSSSKRSKNKSKNKSDSSSKKTSNKTKNKSDVTSKEDSSNLVTSPSLMEKSEMEHKIEAIEPNNTMVWSQPIKIESTMVQSKEEIPTNIFRAKKSQTNEKDSSKSSFEMRTKDIKSEDTKRSNLKENHQSDGMKTVKETAAIVNTENNPAPPFKVQLTEARATKTQETVNSAKKTEHETTLNSSQNVWKQKEPEQKVLRFAGEPVNNDSPRSFPFAGWPNRNNRATRF